MNLNKLFPHLSIRAKLGIAFALLAIIPLGVVAGATTRITVGRLQAMAAEAIARQLRLARSDVERVLQRMEQDVAFLSQASLARLVSPRDEPSGNGQSAVTAFLDHSPFLFRLKVIDQEGSLVYEAGSGTGVAGGSGFYYAWRARMAAPHQTLFLPVELRAAAARPGDAAAVPAVAVVLPVRDQQGEFRGAIVGEAHAATVFAGLDVEAGTLAGATTALVDVEGRFLYHSEHKRDWESLLEEGLGGAEFSGRLDHLGSSGVQLRTATHLVSAEPLRLASSGESLTLLRAVPLRTVNAPVREFLGWVAMTGGAVLLLVAGIATVAARQLTQPIYLLREAASRLARGEDAPRLAVRTNDELEDLALDFGRMADVLASQRRQLEATLSSQARQLAQTHAELAEILEHSADAIIGLDPEGRVRVWNQGAERLFGYAAPEVIGRDGDALLLPPGWSQRSEQDYLRRELERHGAVVNFQTQRQAQDGRSIPVSLTQTAIRDAQGNAIGGSVILRDITLQLSLEQQMRRSERLATMSVLAAGLAHEINNPLAIIANRLEVMSLELAERGQTEVERDVSVLREHTRRLADLTRTLLHFGSDPDEPEGPIRLLPLVTRITTLLERTLASRNVRLFSTGSPALAVLGTEPAFEMVFMNLVLNAADAMPDGGTISVMVRREGTRVRLVVADEGIGVPDDLRERIFEPFFSTKGLQRGTGLGLSLTRTLVERHQGRVWVEANAPRGSRFIVELPILEESAS